MNANAEARLSALDRVLDDQQPSVELGNELFNIVDTLGATPSIRRPLIDQGAPEEARAGLAQTLFSGRVSEPAVRVLVEATRLRWGTPGALMDALERQGIRALLGSAQVAGQLDEVEDQLFKVGRLVDANPELRSTLSDRRTSLEGRQQLLGELLSGKVLPVTAQLAARAVRARLRTFGLTLESYLKTSAELRNRGVATVEVARPLTEEQAARLRSSLSRQVGRDVTLRVIINPTVIGGVRVSMGDEVIEGTVAGRLHDARRNLS